MTTKQIAEAAGVSVNTVLRTGKELYPNRFENGKKTIFTQQEAISIMSGIRKQGFIEPLQNGEVTLVTQNESNVTQEAFKIMAMAFDRLTRITESQEVRLSKIETKIEQRQALLPAPQIKPRDHITKIVRENAQKTGIEYAVAWGCLYKEFGYRTNSNPRLAARNRGMAIIDYIEAEGQIETLEAIAIEHLT